MKSENSEKLRAEYETLVEGLKKTQISVANEEFLINPGLQYTPIPISIMTKNAVVFPEDILHEAVPGNIRKADHFISFLRRLIEYLKVYIPYFMCMSLVLTSG